jgi:hypothetical protein
MPEYTQGLAGEIFADGIYDFQVVDAGEKEAQESHNVMIELQLDVFNADFTDKVRVTDRLVFVPNCYWKIDAFRKATGEKITQNQKVSFEAEDCIDRKGRLQLKTTSYNSKTRNEVDFYIEPDDQSQPATSKPAAAPTSPQAATSQPQPAAKGAVPGPKQGF